MADTSGKNYSSNRLTGSADPFDFTGVIAPYTFIQDVAAPVVTLVSPLDGKLERMTPVVFDVVDNRGLGLQGAFVAYPNISGLYEVAYDGQDLNSPYSSYDISRTVIPATPSTAAGWRYTMLRKKGWLSLPRIRVKVQDTMANVV